MRIGIIGAGKIGYKRAQVVLDIGQDTVAGVYDINEESMNKLSELTGAVKYNSWESLVKDSSIDCVIVATYHKILPKIVSEALKNKKHVLAEKPLGNNAKEAKELFNQAKKSKRILKVGFNHRFHPAILKAHEIVSQNTIGKIMYIRAVYGHGGRKGYDLEWRIQKKYTRGGEMYDQGSHIIDLSEWFVGNFNRVFAITKNYFWKKTSLEDNGFCQLVSKQGQVVLFQVSLTQWKNKFSFEIYGEKGYLLVHGLGRSYGIERLIHGREVGKGAVPIEQVWEFKEGDSSWVLEWQNFINAINSKKQPMSSASENVRVMKIMDGLFKSAKTGKLEKV